VQQITSTVMSSFSGNHTTRGYSTSTLMQNNDESWILVTSGKRRQKLMQNNLRFFHLVWGDSFKSRATGELFYT